MNRLDGRTGVLLMAGLVALATVSVGSLHAGTADSAPNDSLYSASESVESGSLLQTLAAQQTTPDNETTTADDGAVGNHTVSPLALPERPDSLNDASVLRYVVAYEQVRKHNETLEETTDVSITSIDVRCIPTSLDAQVDGFAVEVTCGFSYEFGQDGAPTGIADGMPYTTRYLVTETATELRGRWPVLGGGAARPSLFPTRPEPLTAVSVVPFATDYEEVRKHNELLNETDATVTRADVFCEFDRVTERDGGFVVNVSCDFSYEFRTEDGTVGVADGTPYTARYRITETATELVRVEVVGGNTTTPAVEEGTTTVEDERTSVTG